MPSIIRQSWLGKSEQYAKRNFYLKLARMAVELKRP